MRLKLLIRTLDSLGNWKEGPFLSSQDLTLVGRVCPDLVLTEPRCSKVHAVFFQSVEGRLVLRDLGSTNGTYVNGEKIDEAYITEEEEIRIGKVFIHVVLFEPVELGAAVILSGSAKSKDAIVKEGPDKFVALTRNEGQTIQYVKNTGELAQVKISDLLLGKKPVQGDR